MTPKEQALKLCQEIGRTTMFDEECNDGMTLPLHVSKKIAMIAVQTIIDEIKDINKETLSATITTGNHPSDKIKYWKQVETEIINL